MITAQRARSTRKNYDILLTPASVYAAATAPTGFVVDDVNKTFRFTPSATTGDYSTVSDYEYSLDGGKTWKTVWSFTQPIPGGVAYVIGQVQVRAKARPGCITTAGFSPSAAISNGTAYTSSAAAAFNISNVPNQVFLFDVRNTASITKDGSNNVTQINDLSGNARHLMPISGKSSPTYVSGTYPYIQFSSTNQLGIASMPLSQPFTLYMVVSGGPFTSFANYIQVDTSTYILGNGAPGIAGNAGCTVPALRQGPGDTTFAINNGPAYGVGPSDSSSINLIVHTLNGTSSYYCFGQDFPIVQNYGTSGWTMFNFVGSIRLYAALLVSGTVDPYTDRQIRAYFNSAFATPQYDFFACLGDSITFGYNATSYHGWNYKMCAAIPKRLRNFAAAGTYLTPYANAGASTTSGQGKFWNLLTGPSNGYVFLQYGSNNDYGYPATSNHNLVVKSPAIWKAYMRGMIQALIDYGFPKSKIFLGLPPASPYTSTNLSVAMPKLAADMRALASEMGVQTLDFFTLTTNDVTTYGQASVFDTDNLHPVDAEHQRMATYAQTLIT